MRSIISKAFLALGICSSVYSYAWGLTGHRVVAEIAQKHLTSKSKRQIKKLLGNDQLAYWANWPDFIKSEPTGKWKEASKWHFVNVDPKADYQTFVAALTSQKEANLYNQLQRLITVVKDKNASQEDRKNALVFIVHMMGDMVQPMHTGRAGDLGGNKIEVTYFGQKTNLHSVWDGKLIDSQKYSYTEYANLLDNKSRKERKEIQKGNITTWLYDSHQIANQIYEQTPAGSNLSYEYQYKFNHVVERQLLYGGLRLAKLLNDTFK